MCCQIAEKFGNDNGKYGHWGAKINPESLIRAWADCRLLNFHLHVWANKELEYDGVIMFQGIHNHVTDEKLWLEYLWVSKNPKASIKLLNTALKFGRENGYRKVVMNSVENHPNSPKVRKFYEKMGWKKDSESYLGLI